MTETSIIATKSSMSNYKNHIPLKGPDANAPLPNEVPQQRRERFLALGGGVVGLTLGVVLGILLSANPDAALQEQLTQTKTDLHQSRARLIELERAVHYQQAQPGSNRHLLSDGNKTLIETAGKRYAQALRQAKHHSAGDLLTWFVDRWASLLDQSTPDNRTTQRAQLLAQLVGAMAKNINPGDYIEWQIEFLNQPWLGEVSTDFDGDGLPATSAAPNPRDGFTQVSVCQIAMSLNQLTTDAHVVLTPSLQCDAPSSRLSLFLSGNSIKDALSEFAETLTQRGFTVVDRTRKGVRQIQIGPQ